MQFRQAKEEILNAGKVAYRFFTGSSSNTTPVTEENPSNSNSTDPLFAGTWFKNLINAGDKPPNSIVGSPEDSDYEESEDEEETPEEQNLIEQAQIGTKHEFRDSSAL